MPAGSTPVDLQSQATTAVADAAADSARVQTLRGLACLLLVAFHVIGSQADSGMRVIDSSGWRTFANVFYPLRMPLFSFLSGFVYAYRPIMSGQEGLFVRKKLIRLWLPLLTVTTIYYLGTLAVPGASGQLPLNEAWRIYFFGYVHFWFLQAMLLIFAATLLLESSNALATFGRYAIVLAVAFVLSSVADPNYLTFMSWRKALYLAPFFLLGLGANRFGDVMRDGRLMRACAVVFVITFAVHGHYMATWSGIAQPGSVLGIIVGATGALTLIWRFPNIGVLRTLGAYSFAVYLFHVFFVASTRMVLGMLHFTAQGLFFTGCLLAGLVGPVILELMLNQIPWAKTGLLGQR